MGHDPRRVQRVRKFMSVQDVHRMSEFAKARTLAERGQVAAARAVVNAFPVGEQPQIVADMNVGVQCPSCHDAQLVGARWCGGCGAERRPDRRIVSR